jgi:MFS transporter, ACS family, solute carrier family 17 (sodium-dependent inorganic phosphate cotransporter), other
VPSTDLDPGAAVAIADGRAFAGHSRRWLRRDLLIGLTFFAACLAYTDRVNISVAALAMQQQFGWSQTQKGFVLSSFFIGYMLCLLLSGWLATRFGGKRLLGLAVIVWSVCTLLTPAASAVSLSALVAARIAMGVGESAVFPSAFEILGRWVPANARARATARILSGIPVGQVAGLILAGWMLAHFAWPVAFYSFGAVGLVWAIVWFRFMARNPMNNADESPMEREPLRADARPVQSGEPVLWRKLLVSVPVLALVCGHFASNWTLYVLLAWLPSYFREVLHLSVASAGLFSAGPWLTAAAVTNVAGPVSDRLIAGGVSVTVTRKLMQCGGLLISAGFLLAIRDVHSPGIALVLLCAATGALGLTWCGYAPGTIDVAPRHSALVNGFTNTIATIPGIVGVAVTGWLLDVTGTYSAAFILTAGISVLSAMAFGLFFSARPLIE